MSRIHVILVYHVHECHRLIVYVSLRYLIYNYGSALSSSKEGDGGREGGGGVVTP